MSSGRIATVTALPGAQPVVAQASASSPSRAPAAVTCPGRKFIEPMKSATKAVRGSP